MIYGINTTRDISYHSWYLCQILLQIMLLPIQITSILLLLLTNGMQRTLCPSRKLGVWQIVSNKKLVNDKLVSGKLSKFLLNERLLVNNFQNSCSTENHWTHVTQKTIDLWLYNKCHKIPYVILTLSHLRAWTIETSSSPNDSMKPLIQQIEIFFWYTNCKV